MDEPEDVKPWDLRWVGTQGSNGELNDVWALPSGSYLYVPFVTGSMQAARARAWRLLKEVKDDGA